MASETLFDIDAGAAEGPRRVRPDPVRRAGPGRPPAGRGRRAVRPRRPGLVGQPRPELRDAPGDGPRARPRHGDAARRPGASAGCSRARWSSRSPSSAGRPTINPSLGRDHFASAWSATLSGCGIKGGSVYGKTDDKGQTVVDGEVGAAELFATIYQALGIDHQKNYYVGSRPVPLTEPGHRADRGRAGLTSIAADRAAVAARPQVNAIAAMPETAMPAPARRSSSSRSSPARRSSSRWRACRARSRLVFGGSDFKVYDVDLAAEKPEPQHARRPRELRHRPGRRGPARPSPAATTAS